MTTDPSFRMTVQDVFAVRGRGMIATGQIESGKLTVGDTIWIQRQGSSIRTVVTAIDGFRQQLQQAQKGDTVSAVLRGIELTDIQRGDVLAGLESEQSRASWDKRDKPLVT